MGILYEPKSASEACRCGRLNTRVHCPTCGRFNVRNLASQSDRVFNPVSQKQVEVKVFKCLCCGLRFNDLEWQLRCEAPLFETRSMKQRRKEEAASATLAEYHNSQNDPEKRREFLENIFRKQGIDPYKGQRPQPQAALDSEPAASIDVLNADATENYKEKFPGFTNRKNENRS